MNPIAKLFKQIKGSVNDLKTWNRYRKLQKRKTILALNDKEFTFTESRLDEWQRYAEPKQLNKKKRILKEIRCVDNGETYLLMTMKKPYTLDFKDIIDPKNNEDILDGIAWDITHTSLYNLVIDKTTKLDLIWIGVIGILLGIILGMNF